MEKVDKMSSVDFMVIHAIFNILGAIMKKKEKTDIIKGLFWDYEINPETYLWMAEHPDKADKKDLQRFFIKAFEHLRWHDLLGIFGIETVKKLLTEETRRGLRKEACERYDSVCAILRGESLSVTRQDIENRKQALKPFLSNRWYGA